MHSQVPQFIDIEDKIIGPLTLREFGYLAGGFVIVGIFYMLFQLYLAIILGIPVLGLAGALAFYKINDRPFIYFLIGFLGFGLKQRVYLWKKPLDEYGIFIQQKTTEKQPLFLEKITKFAETSIKRSGWSLNIFGKKEIIPKTEFSEQEEKYNAPIKTVSYKEAKWGPNIVGVEQK